MRIEVLPVTGLGEVAAGDDLAALLVGAAADLRNGDVVVVSQKVVSKAEGAVVALAPGEDRALARRRLALREAVRVVVDAPQALIVETRHGFVCANAGVDASNVSPGTVALLPADPDLSARRLRDGLRSLLGVSVGVIVSDTFGRPWRIGQTDVAIGVAGVAPVRDERGGSDRFGVSLEVTVVAVADEIAAAADLVRRKADGVPVVIVRGLRAGSQPDTSARSLVRTGPDDLFPRGRGALACVLADGGLAPADGRMLDDEVFTRAVAAANGVAGAGVRVRRDAARVVVEAKRPAEAGAAGAAVLAALADAGVAGRLRLAADPLATAAEVVLLRAEPPPSGAR